jgi:hypothetical protein
MQNKGDEQTLRKFARIRTRQLAAMVLALFLMIVLAAVWKRPDIFGQFSKRTIAIAQILVVLSFINFSSWNWTCPSCKKYLGHDLHRQKCRKCGARLR